MQCPWCANPEGMALNGLESKNKHFKCNTYEVEEVIEEVKRSALLFYDGGGVTLSGGEVTLQFEAVKELLSKLKALDIHTAIETNGTHPRLEELFDRVDQLIMDFKHYDGSAHLEITGVSNFMIRQNIEKALRKHPRVLIRIPLIKGFNDAEEDAKQFAAFFKELPHERACFEFLPYHDYGAVKWEQCGMNYKMKDAHINRETLLMYTRVFETNRLLIIAT